MQLNDILLKKLTNIQYLEQNMKNPDYTPSEFARYATDNKTELGSWYHSYDSDYRRRKSIDEFCFFLINNLRRVRYRKPHAIGFDERGTYEPERFFTRGDRPYWYPVSETTGGRNYRRLHIYKSPNYTNQEFLPSQYTGHRRLYAPSQSALSSELSQTTANSAYDVTSYAADVKITPDFGEWIWYGGPTRDVATAIKYRNIIPSKIFDKIIYAKPISVFEYAELVRLIPNEHDAFARAVSDAGWPLYDNMKM